MILLNETDVINVLKEHFKADEVEKVSDKYIINVKDEILCRTFILDKDNVWKPY